MVKRAAAKPWASSSNDQKGKRVQLQSISWCVIRCFDSLSMHSCVTHCNTPTTTTTTPPTPHRYMTHINASRPLTHRTSEYGDPEHINIWMYEYINRSIYRDDMSIYQYVSIYQYMKTNCRHVGDDANTFSNPPSQGSHPPSMHHQAVTVDEGSP